MDEFSEVTTVSWFSRIKESIKSVLLGLLLFFGSFPLLWWNEGRAVQTAESLEEGKGLVVSVASDKVDAAHEGKLVHMSGLAHTDSRVKDSDFGVDEQAIKLMRTVEMFQWVEREKTETKKRVGGGEKKKTTYRYTKEWAAEHHDSSEFEKPQGHSNPAMRFEDKTVFAQNVTLGAFSLPEDMVDDIGGATPLVVKSEALDEVTPAIRNQTKVVDGAFYVRPGAASADFDAGEPQVGDHRIRFKVVPAAEISVVAQQRGSSFQPFQTKAGDAISMVEMGTLGAEQMFTGALEANAMLTWILRGVGWLLMAIGLMLVLRPIAVVADILPFMGSVVSLGVFVLSVAIALPLSLLTIAVAWVAVRPVLGIALLVLVLVLVAGLVLLFVRKRRAKAAQGAAPAG